MGNDFKNFYIMKKQNQKKGKEKNKKNKSKNRKIAKIAINKKKSRNKYLNKNEKLW